MQHFQVLLVFASCLVATFGRTLRFQHFPPRGKTMTWKDCGSAGAVIQDVTIEPWDSSGSNPVMHSNKSYNVTVVFKATKAATKATTHAYGKLGPSPRIEWPLPNPDACGDPYGTVTCPLKVGKTYTYRKNVFVSKYYPPYQYLVYWELHNESDDRIFCIIFPLSIKRIDRSTLTAGFQWEMPGSRN